MVQFLTRKSDKRVFVLKDGSNRRSSSPPNELLEQKGRIIKNNDKIKTVADVMSLNAKKGMFFFSPDTLKFFNSRILGGELQGNNKNLFITSEKQPSFRGEKTFRRFSIRKVNKKSGDISTVGEFQQFATQKQAEKFIKDKNL